MQPAEEPASAGATTPRQQPRLFYGWYVALAGASNNFIVFGLTVWGFGVFIEPLRREFHWSTAAIAAGFSIRSFQQGFMAPFAGVLIDRFGPRRMVVLGTLLLARGLLLFASAHNLTMYYGASLVIAMGQSIGSFTAFSAALMRWFVRKRGRAMGVLNAGNGAGYLLVPAVAFLVTHAGWREALVAGAALLLALGVPLALLVRDDPEDVGQAPDGDPVVQRVGGERAALPGLSVREAVHVPAFYLLALAQAAGGATISGWTVHTIPHLEHAGVSLGAATMVGVIYAVCQLAFRPTAGVLGDRFGRRRMFALAYALQAIGIVLFAFVSRDRLWVLPLYYATFAFGQAAWSVLQAAIVADYFGPRRFGTINGLVNIVQMPLGLASPIIAGYVFDRHDTYVPVFVAYAVCSLAAGSAVWLIRRLPLQLARAE